MNLRINRKNFKGELLLYMTKICRNKTAYNHEEYIMDIHL